MSALGASYAERLWRSLWKSEWVKRSFYDLLAVVIKNRADRMLNCGLALSESEGFPSDLVPEGESPFGYQLYWKICKDQSDGVHSILEVGSGAGDGLAFLCRWLEQSKAEGIDASKRLVRIANRRNRDSRINFTFGTAYSIPYDDSKFGLVISVEVSHALENKKRFLSEVSRVMKSDGRFVWSDFFYCRETAAHSISNCEKAIEESDLEIESVHDNTDSVLASLNSSTLDREVFVDSNVWKPFRQIARDFAVTKDSSLFKCLDSGRGKHLCYVLKR